MCNAPSEIPVRAGVWSLAVTVILFVLSGGRPPESDSFTTPQTGSSSLSSSPSLFMVAEDQILNEGSSAPSVSSSLVEGGLSAGTVGDGGVIEASADFADPVGEDSFRGTSDDDLLPAPMAASIDAGDNGLLPQDRFDLDDDGDTSEPLPIDFVGYERVADRGSGTATVDLGALEFDARQIARQSPADIPDGSFELAAPYPNPAASTATISFVAGRASHARVSVFDVLGREVLVPFDGAVTPGYEVETGMDVSSLSAGLYMIRLEAGSYELETGLTVAR